MTASIFKICYLIGFILASMIRGVYARQYNTNRIKDDHESKRDKLLLGLSSLGMLIPLFYVFTPWMDFADYHLPFWVGWIGVVVFAFAIWLLWRSHIDLGRNWSPALEIIEEQSLVTQGVYTHIRHPMYAAHLLWGLSQVLLLQNWIAGFAMLVFFLPLYLVRVPREERMMLEHFGDGYRTYMSRTGRVFPRFG
jgi:protein-S-isoprenylcysteine O-methyltransferase Ste14